MKTRFIASTALMLAAALGGTAGWAQSTPTPRVLSDVAPLPPEDRSSVGAVVLPERPVLAQREMADQTMARTQQLMTTSMGAGPAVTVQSDEGQVQVIKPARAKREKQQ